MRQIICALLLLSTGCALFKPKSPQTSDHAAEVPAWAYAPMEECMEERQLCASGEGKTGTIAEANAMKSLAAIFETKIEASTSSTMTVSGHQSLAQATELAQTTVRDEVKQTLEAAQVIKKHRYQNMSYALASLDKEKASANLKAALDKVQAELSALWERRDRTAWARMWELFQVREGLNDRYNIINAGRIPFSPTASELQKWYQSRKAEVPLALEILNLPSEYEAHLKARLTNSGYRLFSLNTGARLQAQMTSKQEHMNVAGFEKWFFNLSMTNISKAGAKIGGLSVSTTATGRSKVDCEMKARAVLIKEMEEKLHELNLQD
ncbi:MAG: LPP20 family lipoprotein [Proteobacteria bacterium]|nr:LPP20 family lipoprotein [Pseudomonadota bacterium]